MRSTTALSDERRYSAMPFFRFTFNQNAHQLALYVIVVLLAMLIPCFMITGDDSISQLSAERLEELAEDSFRIISVIGIVVSMIIGVFAGMSAMAYVNSKQAIGCYHSFPVRREWIFMCETSVRAIYYLIAICAGYVISYFSIIAAMPIAAKYTGIYVMLALSAILCFMYVYSIAILAGSLTGSAFMRFAMIFIITFLPFALYMVVVATIQMAVPQLMINYYTDLEKLKYFFSFIRVVYNINDVTEYERFLPILWIIPESLVYYFGAMLLNKKRKSETTGTTVIWKPVFVVVKYALIIVASLLAMILFGELFFGGRDGMSMMLGTIAGLVLSFMLVNSIMYRSSRMMFQGWKPFIAVAVATILYMFFVPMNVWGAVGRPISAVNTSSITVKINNNTIEFKDRETIEKIVSLLEDESEETVPEFAGISYENDAEVLKEIPSELYIDSMEQDLFDKYYYEDNEKYMYILENVYLTSVEVIQKPRVGIPLAREYEVNLNGELWDIITESDEYVSTYNVPATVKDFDHIEELDIEYASEYFSIFSNDIRLGNNYYHDTGDILDTKVMSDLFSACVLKEEYTDSPLLGTIRFYYTEENNTRRKSVLYPVYADDIETVKALNSVVNYVYYSKMGEYILPLGFKDINDFYKAIVDNNSVFLMVNSKSGKAKLLTPEQVCDLAKHTASFGFRGSEYDVMTYSSVSHSPYMILMGKYVEQYDYNYDYDSNDYGRAFDYRVIRFREGALSDTKLEDYFDDLDK